ncbi:MAG: rRNA maturation RNase YbeY [Phycisphaera sp.]|nr:rRNA maturation RNase YbeY [Phycisphaera sp.]
MSADTPAIAFHRGDGCAASVDCAALAAAFASLVPHFPRRLARIDVLLVGDDAMDAAHRRFMDIPGTTDVMSFPAHDESDPAAAVEADLVVSVDVAAREAAARGHAMDREILLYAVHGALHACGHRDDTPESAAAIHAEEDRILALGAGGVVYARPLLADGGVPPPADEDRLR